MASTFRDYSYEGLKELYSKHRRNRSTIEADVKQWLKEGILEGKMVRAFLYDNRVHISSKYWVEFLKKVDSISFIKDYSRSYYISYGEAESCLHSFVAAFHGYVRYGSVSKYLRISDFALVDRFYPYVKFAMADIIKNPDYVDFSVTIPSAVLDFLFLKVIQVEWDNLKPSISEELLRKLYIDNTDLPDTYRVYFECAYLDRFEMLKSGNVLEILKKVPEGASDTYNFFYAHYYMLNGNPDEAFKLYSQGLKHSKAIIFNDTLTNFFYALSIGLSGLPKAVKAGEKILKAKDIKNYEPCYPMFAVLHHFLTGDAVEYVEEHLPREYLNPQASLLTVLFVKHYKLFSKDLPEMRWAETFVKNSEYDLLKYLFSDDFDSLKAQKEELSERTGITQSLMPPVKKMESWEKVIDQVLKNVALTTKPAKKSGDQAEMSRVVYLLNMKNLSLQPKLQKSKDGGVTWSKGRNIAMNRFASCAEPAMSTQDIRVANRVETVSYYYGGSEYILAGASAIAELVGSTCVFDERTEQPIDIREEPLQLLVQPSSSGFTVRSNIQGLKPQGGICLKKDGDKQITIIRTDESQLKTIELLGKVKVFPQKSEEQLTRLLETLSVNFTVMSPLLKNSKELKTVPSSPLIVVQLSPADGQEFQVSLAVKPFGTHPPYQRPGKGMEVVSATIDDEQVQTERDLKKEKENLRLLLDLMEDFDADALSDDTWLLDTAQCLQMLEIIRQHQDICCAEWPRGAKLRVVKPMLTPDHVRLKISSAGQWFELEGEVDIDEKTKLKMAELMSLLSSSQGNFVRLADNEYIALSDQLRRQLQALEKVLAGRGKQLKVAQVNGMQLSALEELGVQVDADLKFKNLVDRIRDAGQKEFKIPSNIHAELRPYQQTGYQWMSRLAWWGAGACLADDMGLGKTLQAITLMQSRAEQGPQLVIVPTSLLHNWQQELKRFAPALNAHNLNQVGADRGCIVKSADVSDIVISTYGLLVTEGELLASRTWSTIVLDEAHSIKNRETQTSKGAMELKGDFRLLLTGTPLQNHLSEIWNLFQFANPGLLGSFKQFADRFIIPVERDHDKDRQRLLKRILSPFLLRRTKDEVLDELPEKTEITIRVELSPEEQALYDNLRQRAIANLEEGQKSPVQTLAEITKLRQAACHPKLVNPKLNLPSSKTAAFLELVDTLRSGGHRVLVFSQFTSHLALIREQLDQKEVPYLYLDGTHSASQRNKLVQQFQTGDMPLFLISLKAGGLGLNLTAADYVIHLDPWWNPAIEDQASDRAHRIGQERPVTVYRIIAANTIEEKIIRLHQNKRSMADALLQDADMFAQISADDVVKLLRESVDAIG